MDDQRCQSLFTSKMDYLIDQTQTTTNPNSCESSATMENNNNKSKNGKRSKGGGGGGVRLSTDPQSVAARQRRHRISDRFKILQSLVPGGSKMDTVSMLDEAIHYVKYLKTQIWLHQNMINFIDDHHSPSAVDFSHDDDEHEHHVIMYSQQQQQQPDDHELVVQPSPPATVAFPNSCYHGSDTIMSFDGYNMKYY